MAKRPSRAARLEELRARRRRQRIIIGAVIAAALLGFVALAFVSRQLTRVLPDEVALPESLTPPENADGAAWGPVDAPVLIEEYSDFQ